MSDIRLSKDMIGNKVRCIYKADCYHPEIGTIGTIVDYDKRDEDASYKVRWPKGTTSGNDRWWASNKCIELVEDDLTNEQEISEMTNEEIWEMLKPKMEKNNVLSELGVLCQGEDKLNKLLDTSIIDGKYVTDVYPAKAVQYAIAITYRSGYERAMKGRPFKIGEKKKGGHWEPVDIKDVLKGEHKIVEDCLGWHYEYLGTYKKGEDGKFYQWVEDDE